MIRILIGKINNYFIGLFFSCIFIYLPTQACGTTWWTKVYIEKYGLKEATQFSSNKSIINIGGKKDSISYANEKIRAFVEKYALPETGKSAKKVKKNKHYNANFAELIATLEASDKMFTFTDDASLTGGKNSTVGLVLPAGDGHNFQIVVPEYSPGSEKAKLLLLMGGRGNVLAEETLHAVQIHFGIISTRGKSITKGTASLLAAEVDAKIFASSCGMSKFSSTKIIKGYNIPTMAKLIKKASGDRIEVLHLITKGTTWTIALTRDGKSLPLAYPPSYDLF